MTKENKSISFGLMAVLFWSTAATAFKIGLKHTEPVSLLLLSSFFSLIIFLLFYLFNKKKKFNSASVIRSALLGFLNPFLYYIILFTAYDRLPAQEALTLNYTWAIIVAVLSMILLGHKFRLIGLLSLLLGFIGVIFIATKGKILSLEFNDIPATLLALSTAFIWGFYWILNVKDNRSDIEKMTLNFFFGTIYILIYFLINERNFDFNLNAILSSIFIGAFEMGFTFLLWINALKLSDDASKLSNLIFLSPFISLIFISLILNEKIHVGTISGLILIVLAIFLSNLKIRRN